MPLHKRLKLTASTRASFYLYNTPEEIDRAKAQIRAGLLMALESPAARAGQIARQMLIHGRVLSLEEITAKIQAVDARMARQVAADVFFGGTPTLSAIGPLAKVPIFDEVSARLATPQLRVARG